jgi:hypothetical protein
MHACQQKQVAFNRRVLKPEEEVSGINSGLADFLQEMSFAPENPVYVCVNVGERTKGTQPIGGQLWTQECRQMSVTNKVVEDRDSSRKAVALSGRTRWTRALEGLDNVF